MWSRTIGIMENLHMNWTIVNRWDVYFWICDMSWTISICSRLLIWRGVWYRGVGDAFFFISHFNMDLEWSHLFVFGSTYVFEEKPSPGDSVLVFYLPSTQSSGYVSQCNLKEKVIEQINGAHATIIRLTVQVGESHHHLIFVMVLFLQRRDSSVIFVVTPH